MTENNISRNQVLTISAIDYFAMSGKQPADFEPIGVHVESSAHFDSCGKYESTTRSPLELFIEQVPEGTEVVVDYRATLSGQRSEACYNPIDLMYLLSGTALVPKNKQLSEHTE